MRGISARSIVLAICALGAGASSVSADEAPRAERVAISLDGTWDIDDSVAADRIPEAFHHTVPVPGLAHSSTPAFADVDAYQSKQLLSSLVYYDKYSQADYDKLGDIRGISHQQRNYFWYHKRFDAPSRRAVAILEVDKAQFGTVVYLNGVNIGKHDSCFTAAYFDVSRAIHWNKSNELIIRIGAHPGVLPATVVGGTDFEKNRWTPGIYDSVSLIAADNPVITAVQVAPQLAGPANPVSGAIVQTELRNYSSHAVDTPVRQSVVEWKSGRAVAGAEEITVRLAPGETRLVKQLVSLPGARLWSPEDPFLYQIHTQTSGDDTQTRFGMREFHFDTVTQRAYLNGKPYFLRGSNIALHRFFEDPQSGTLPWDEAWTRRLLVDIPKQLHWNAFRFTISPVPKRWLDIADESGLLIQYEYAVWVGSPVYTVWKSSYDIKQMMGEYTEWMRDSWNHPSIVIWDATNESTLPEFASKIVPTVRSLDLSNRAWENSYNPPDDGNDPIEDHTYFLESIAGKFDASEGGKPFEYSDLEWMDGTSSNPFTKSAHAKILNEYGWIWLNRDGSPTLLTEQLFTKLLGDKDSVEARRALVARNLGAETELWRAYRRYAGVLHFAYLTSSDPGGFTSDNFVDIRALTLEPHFEAAMRQAFKPMGVYLNFWHSRLDLGETRPYEIYMVNDEGRPRTGRLRLAFFDGAGQQAAAQAMRFSLKPWGAQMYSAELAAPSVAGQYTLRAIATADDEEGDPTISIRDVALKPTDKR
jgi:beta-galactosidase